MNLELPATGEKAVENQANLAARMDGSELFNGFRIGDEVVYELKRWEVTNTRLSIQVPGQPHRPNMLRLWRPTTGEGIWAPSDACR